MIRPLLSLLRTSPERPRAVLFALIAVLSLIVGFFTVGPVDAKTLIEGWGYYYMLGMFALFVFYAWRVGQARREVWRGWLRAPGWPGIAIVAASAFAIWSDPFDHKILFDEFVLQGTAFQMHATKEIATVIRAYDIAGSWVPIDTFLDKRPYFFVFLVSLVHDLTGYRVANLFLVNVALTPVLFALVYWFAREFTGRRGPAVLAVALLATMPLLGQNSTGAGMELHNLVMIALVVALAVLWLRAPDPDRLSLLVLGALLLAQSRYESTLFVVPVALVIVVGWLRAGRVILSWPAVFAPLFLAPRVWHQRFVDSSPLLWQLHDGDTSRFGVGYLPGNVSGAWHFFFNLDPDLPNSWYLSALGMAGLAWALVCAWRWTRASRTAGADPASFQMSPTNFVLAAFGAGIAANLWLLMFYYWSRLDDVIAARFALPACLLLAWLAAWFVCWLDERHVPAMRFAAAGLVVWLFGWSVPAMARRLYTNQNLVLQELEWEHEELLKRHDRLLFISNKSTLPFVLWHIPSLITGVARLRTVQIKYHFNEGTFNDIIVAQALRPTTPQGDWGVDPDDALPENFHLEPFAQKRFGGRFARLSRLVAIDDLLQKTKSPPPPSAPPSTLAPAASPRADSQ